MKSTPVVLHRGWSVAGARRGLAFVGLAFAGLVLAACSVAMAISTQAGTARNALSATLVGRQASEMVESALEECLARFTTALQGVAAGRDMRGFLLARAGSPGTTVYAQDVLGVESFSFPPAKTLALAREEAPGLTLTPVLLRPLSYSLAANTGEIQLSAAASQSVGGRRTVFRRITVFHTFVLDGDGTFRVRPLANRTMVSREDGL